MDLTKISMRLKSALAVEHRGSITGAQINSIVAPLLDAIDGLNKEVIAIERKVARLETQLQSQHSQPHKDE